MSRYQARLTSEARVLLNAQVCRLGARLKELAVRSHGFELVVPSDGRAAGLVAKAVGAYCVLRLRSGRLDAGAVGGFGWAWLCKGGAAGPLICQGKAGLVWSQPVLDRPCSASYLLCSSLLCAQSRASRVTHAALCTSARCASFSLSLPHCASVCRPATHCTCLS